MAVHDACRVAVERPHRRARGAPALESYWPPWHGQPNVLPKARTGQPRCMQVLAIAVNLSLAVVAHEDDAPVDAPSCVGRGDRVNVTTWNGFGLSTGKARRPEVDVVVDGGLEHRCQHEGERRYADHGGHQAAEADGAPPRGNAHGRARPGASQGRPSTQRARRLWLLLDRARRESPPRIPPKVKATRRPD